MSSALRNELSKMVRPASIDPDTLPMKTMFWRLLVEQLQPKTTTEGGIALADSTLEAEKSLTSIGRVLQIGHSAFTAKTPSGILLSDEPNIPKVGDYVLYQRYAGQEIDMRNGRKLRILLDTEVLMLVSDPDQIRHYI
jgi:co-chaperonin GroES (HSP10)